MGGYGREKCVCVWLWAVEWSWELLRVHTHSWESRQRTAQAASHTSRHTEEKADLKGRGKSTKEEKKKKKRVREPAWPCTNPPTCLRTLRSRTSSRLMKTSERSIKVSTRVLVMTATVLRGRDGRGAFTCVFVGGKGFIHLSSFVLLSDSAQVQTCDYLHMHLAVPFPFIMPGAVCVWKRAAAVHAASLDCWVFYWLLHMFAVTPPCCLSECVCESPVDLQECSTLIYDHSNKQALPTSDHSETKRRV